MLIHYQMVAMKSNEVVTMLEVNTQELYYLQSLMMQAPDPEIDGLDCSDLYGRLDQTRVNANNELETFIPGFHD